MRQRSGPARRPPLRNENRIRAAVTPPRAVGTPTEGACSASTATGKWDRSGDFDTGSLLLEGIHRTASRTCRTLASSESGGSHFRSQLDGATRSPAFAHCDKHLYDALACLGLRGPQGSGWFGGARGSTLRGWLLSKLHELSHDLGERLCGVNLMGAGESARALLESCHTSSSFVYRSG